MANSTLPSGSFLLLIAAVPFILLMLLIACLHILRLSLPSHKTKPGVGVSGVSIWQARPNFLEQMSAHGPGDGAYPCHRSYWRPVLGVAALYASYRLATFCSGTGLERVTCPNFEQGKKRHWSAGLLRFEGAGFGPFPVA